MLLLTAPSLAAAQAAQAQRPARRQAGVVDGVAYLLAVERVADLPAIPAGWEVRMQWALTTIDLAAILPHVHDPIVAYLLGRAAERLGL